MSTALNCLLNNIEFGLLPAEAVTASRFSTGHHQNSFSSNPNRKETVVELASLRINKGVGKDVIEELKKRGHNVEITSEAIATPVMIYKDLNTKVIYAAGDPRQWRHA